MANIYSMVDTWNEGSTTFTAIKMNVVDTASDASSLLMDLQVGGSSKFKVTKSARVEVPDNGWFGGVDADTGFQVVGGGRTVDFKRDNSIVARFGVFASFGSHIGLGTNGASTDIFLYRDAANTLAQRNGTNAQTFNLYNTYTDASNYERGFMKWNSNVLEIGTEAAGTGTGRNLKFLAGGTVMFTAQTNGTIAGGSLASADSGFLDIYTSKIAALAQTTSGGSIRLRGSASGGPPYISISSAGSYVFASGTSAINNAPDTGIARDSAGVVKITDGSTGTGELIFIVPTSDPGITGALWNNGGTLAISA